MKPFQSIEQFMSQDISTIKTILIANLTPYQARIYDEDINALNDHVELNQYLCNNFPKWSLSLFGIENQVKHFNQGLCPIKSTEGKWGYMNTEFQIVIPQIFQKVGRYKEDQLACYSLGYFGAGVMNKQGKSLIPDIYDSIELDDETQKYYCNKKDQTLCFVYDKISGTMSDPQTTFTYDNNLN